MPFVKTQDLLIRRLYLISLILGIFLLVLVGLLWKRLPPELPLFYSLPWGESQIVNKPLLLLPPAIILLFNSLGIILTRFFLKDSLSLKMLWGGIATATVLGGIAVIRIIFLVL